MARLDHQMEPHSRCKPSGGPRQLMTPYGVEFVDIPELKQMFIMDVGGPHTSRVIYMDGRPHPKKLAPSYYGHNVGHLEGDTLVVDSVGYNESFWIDREESTTEQLHLIERFRTNVNAAMRSVSTSGVRRPGLAGSATNGRRKRSCSIRHQEGASRQLLVGGAKSIERDSRFVP
jgi:hypothetical protein